MTANWSLERVKHTCPVVAYTYIRVASNIHRHVLYDSTTGKFMCNTEPENQVQ